MTRFLTRLMVHGIRGGDKDSKAAEEEAKDEQMEDSEAAGKSDDAFLEKHIGEFVDECMPLGLHHLAVDVTLNRTEANRSRIVHS